MDYITAENCPKLQLRGKNFPMGYRSQPNTQGACDPHHHYRRAKVRRNLVANHSRNLIILMQKRIDTSLLPFVSDTTSAAKTYAVHMECFPKNDNAIRQLLLQAEAITFDDAEKYVEDHQIVQKNNLKATSLRTNQAMACWEDYSIQLLHLTAPRRHRRHQYSGFTFGKSGRSVQRH